MKKLFWIIGGLIAAALLVGFIYKDLVMLMVFKTWVKPATTFAETATPPAPDYSNPQHWAALPAREDAADFTPEGISDGQADATVDVFFVHPTTFLSSTGWNAPMGALHVRWLLERKISGTQLRERMVVAYPVGYPMGVAELAETIPDIPVCESAAQTSCLLSWNTIGDGYRPFQPTQGQVCVNPLTWTADDTAGTFEDGTFEDNQGALSIVANTLIPGVADGRCENGMLYVSEIRTDAYDNLPNMGKGNHHLLDYALYWSNIRRNVAERVATFRKTRG